ncbi:peptidoglycan D,D-transpeptidase FtsI family protein [Sulfoacidibacillus thermotolerans]|uniref:Penicillin-binding protein 2 n=1 Tax=Sulfoacidibacillus thermotolerans TaxID=1765684 RepID=A0A2U3DC12_SULT2|nr:penicillin-binding transpeptidase domain-containing protein [Sulfoacidibacillus thermotolerans]PWI58824.1 hypothetical protein BM613_01655 [Sulfoacidibacillus thermotolerans]
MTDEKFLLRQKRFNILQLGSTLALGLLILKLASMEMVGHDHYAALSTRNRVDTFPTPAPRGTIFDRNHHVLVYDQPVFSLVYARNGREAAPIAQKLAPILGISQQVLISRMTGYDSGSVHTLLATHIPEKAIAYVGEHQSELPGIRIIPDSVRVYPQGDLACHILGYINSIPEQKRDQYVLQNGFPPSAKVGWSGVELSYDRALRGQPGRICVEVNSEGVPERTLPDSRLPKRGADLTLTIDAEYQRDVQQLLARQVEDLHRHGHKDVSHAMAVALDPNTGAVLALASVPTYHPEWFVSGMSYRTYTNQFAPAERNWSTQAAVAPGSTLKPLTGLFGLMQHVITPTRSIDCSGGLRIPATNGTVIRCWTRHGKVTLATALAESCDVYFYQASLDYGHWPPPHDRQIPFWLHRTRLETLHKLEQLQRAFGLGRETGIDLPDANTGYVNEGSGQVTDLPYTAIGQNEVFTPLELAVYASTLATGGVRVTPYVVQSIAFHNTHPKPVRNFDALRLGLRPEDMAVVKWGMYLTCNAPNGTAYSTFHGKHPASYVAAGKTGTAETGIVGFDNSVFIGYAPFDHPKIAVAVVIPGGGHGADSSVPIARAMFDRFFAHASRKMPPLR